MIIGKASNKVEGALIRKDYQLKKNERRAAKDMRKYSTGDR